MTDSYSKRVKERAKKGGRILEYEDPEVEKKYWHLVELFDSIMGTDFNSQVYYFSEQDLKDVIRFKSAQSLADVAILIMSDGKENKVKRKEKEDG